MGPWVYFSHLHATAESSHEVVMKNVQVQTIKLFSRCFSKEEFELLRVQPEFVEATRKLETFDDALRAVDLGEQLIRQSWKRVSYPFPAKPISPPPPSV